ncbi:hypothetical protein ABID82_001299 [Methylobacterium sp. PvP062]|jgi:hypothetical protein|uniref:Uncharacterized protein n=2 Tax=Methylobacterium TaxID=407 RepID=A0AA37TFH6_9HYPH|nr:hypothetical protein [Methylobacterium sp. PvP105]MBP2502035.1 hypothetical protein [Methylobacterium sp. PvP109]PVY94445.1 hypothetical protein C7388_12810 [Methylobacterium organophilum]GJE48190.1 hypothetical protein GOFOIKOB_1217 [Methylobacterium tardum]GLS72794.1 hypothetical protein GCM10007890_48090 [Methylobacterium tardum]
MKRANQERQPSRRFPPAGGQTLFFGSGPHTRHRAAASPTFPSAGTRERADRYSERKEREPERLKAVVADIGFVKR